MELFQKRNKSSKEDKEMAESECLHQKMGYSELLCLEPTPLLLPARTRGAHKKITKQVTTQSSGFFFFLSVRRLIAYGGSLRVLLFFCFFLVRLS